VIFEKSEIIRLDTTDSTNQHMTELMKTGNLAEGSVVCCRAQTKGMGQEGNTWESEPGKNLTATIVLYPSFLKPEFQFQLTRIISLSVCSVLDKLNLPFRSMIKWPNDIYIDNRKVAGILIRNEISGNSISGSIAGLGLNVNQNSFPAGISGAVSLFMLTGIEYDLEDILTDWHSGVAYWYGMLAKGNSEIIESAYLERMYLLNQPAEFTIRGEKMTATIKGLAEYGMLLLEGSDGSYHKCSLKEVVFSGNKPRIR
jgi:BirA family biotin operon repressor/biotin-[acetyl-CoA-carboxylase] ligase